MPSRDEAEAFIRATLPPEDANAVVASLRHSAKIRTVRVDAERDIPIGTSKFGGVPHLPPGFEWPTALATPNVAMRKMYYDSKRLPDGSLPNWAARMLRELDSRDDPHPLPLDFLAQINLADVPAAPEMWLPEQGFLYFFYLEQAPMGGVSDERDMHRVIHLDVAADDLAPAERPGPRRLPFNRLHPCRVEFIPEVMVPFDFSHPVSRVKGYSEVVSHMAAGFGGTDQRIGGYPHPIQGDVFSEIEADARRPVDGGSGWPAHAEDEMSYEEIDRAERAFAAAAADHWRLLLQLDMDENVGWHWGDAGRLFFLIPKDNLQRRQFRRAEILLQSH